MPVSCRLSGSIFSLPVTVLTGISSHLGRQRGKQDATGSVLLHIKDLSISHAHEKGNRGNTAYTTAKQVFHSDLGDLIALMALETAAEGGTSRLSSDGYIYNELAATRPDLIRTLAEPWHLDTSVQQRNPPRLHC